MKQLYDYQKPSADALERALRNHRVAADCSDTGSGKGIVACEVARRVGGPIAVICPRLMCEVWRDNLRAFGIEPLFCIGYEKLRAGGTEWGRFAIKRWKWNLPNDTLLIFDENHKCKSPTSLSGKILAASKSYRVLMLSATMAMSPLDLKSTGYLLGMHNYIGYWKWLRANGCYPGPFGQLIFGKKNAEKVLLNLHSQIFPEKGYRIRIAELGSAFPETSITAECYEFPNAAEVTAAYEEAGELLNEAILRGESATSAVFQMKARQKAEILKVDGLASMVTDLVEEGSSVVVFVSFRETLSKLRDKLGCGGVYGGQSEDERQAAIAAFQRDEARVLICNVVAGSSGISLHDINGRYPRVSLITPTFHAVDLRQCLGRVHRAGGKSKSIQKLVFSKHTPEERIFRRVQAKLNNIDKINDGDLDSLVELAENTLSSPPPTIPENKVADSSCEVSATSYVPAATSPGMTATEPTAERKHAPLSPSVLKSKAICPGYASDQTGDRSFADRGTLGHLAAEREDLSLIVNDEPLRQAAQRCIDYTRAVIANAKRGGKVQVLQEEKLFYADGQWGFADTIVLGAYADIIDLKFTVTTHAAESPQFLAYVWAVLDRWPHINRVKVHVPHPFLGFVETADFFRDKDYDRIVGEVTAIIARARRNDPADYQVSAQCQYCAHLSKCSKVAALGLDIARRYSPETEIPDIDFHGSHVTDPEHFKALLKIKPIVEKSASGWGAAALDMWDSGTAIPGYEVVEKRGQRSVASARAAFDLIKREIAPDLKPEDYIEFCSVNATSLDSLAKAVSKRGQKGKTVERLEELLIDNEVLTTGGGARYLKAVRK